MEQVWALAVTPKPANWWSDRQMPVYSATINKACMCSVPCGDCPLRPLRGVERDNIVLKSNLDIAVAVWSHVGSSRLNDAFQISSEPPPFEPQVVLCKKGYVCVQAFSHLLY